MGCVFVHGCFQVKLGELEAELLEINANNEHLQRTYSELLEYKLVLQKVWLCFTAIAVSFMGALVALLGNLMPQHYSFLSFPIVCLV